MVNPEEINIVKCDCGIAEFDSLGKVEGLNQITHMFRCLYCGKESIVKETKTSSK